MIVQKVRELIDLYKKNFAYLNQQEIYKWRMVKQFQEHWDIGAENFVPMLKASFEKTSNLLASGQYFPRRMLYQNAALEPESVRRLFVDLFDEEKDLHARIRDFRDEFNGINSRYFPGKASYQDDRAVLVYLCLKYPDIYYLYKYTMFKDFVGIVDYPYLPIQGRSENISQFLTMCSLLREEIRDDSEILELHASRIGKNEYFDTSGNILTQDLIYATTYHLPKLKKGDDRKSATDRLTKVPRDIKFRTGSISLEGRFTNYIDLEREKKRIGDLGELLVLEWESEKLSRARTGKSPVHMSASKGDGLGYDILSYDEKGREIYIEVKTTTGGPTRPFFITANELERSIQNSSNFVLYRLFDFDPVKQTAKYFEIRGDLTEYCSNPVLFRVIAS